MIITVCLSFTCLAFTGDLCKTELNKCCENIVELWEFDGYDSEEEWLEAMNIAKAGYYGITDSLIEQYGDFITEEYEQNLRAAEYMIVNACSFGFMNEAIDVFNKQVEEIEAAKIAADEAAAQAEAEAAAQAEALAQAEAAQYEPEPQYVSSISEYEAKEWIAQRESGGSYSAQNGRYWGRYQLDSSWFEGYDIDFILYTEEGHQIQEEMIESYVAGRYGSWVAAYNFWQNNGWY